MRPLVYVAILLVTLCGQLANADEDPEVTIKLGKIRGLRESCEGRQVNVFLGIPYSEPPLGNLRFKKPRPLTAPWKDVVLATTEANACPQIQTRTHNMSVTEDCLYLNVWSPVDTETNHLKPVVLWIHGGAFYAGSSRPVRFGGTQLSALGDVVYVSINYRLGPFGFLYGGRDDIPGNVGIWDQIVAFEWVKDNIRYFGGDPDQITVMGQSAGGMSVGVHLLSPVSQRMIKNAVMLGNSPLTPKTFDSPAEALKRAKDFAERLGCRHADDDDDRLSDDELECLAKADTVQLLSKSLQIPSKDQIYRIIEIPWKVMYGDSVLPVHPLTTLDDGVTSKINVLIGENQNEASYVELIWRRFNFELKSKTKDDYVEAVTRVMEAFVLNNTLSQGDLSRLYFDPSANDPTSLKRTLLQAIGDYVFLCPGYLMGEKMASSTKVYGFYFDYKATVIPISCTDDLGTCHGDELPFIFGHPLRDGSEYNDVEKDLSRKFIKIIADFATTGRPQILSDGSEWPPFFATSAGGHIVPVQKLMNPRYKGSYTNGINYIKCQFWNKYIEAAA